MRTQSLPSNYMRTLTLAAHSKKTGYCAYQPSQNEDHYCEEHLQQGAAGQYTLTTVKVIMYSPHRTPIISNKLIELREQAMQGQQSPPGSLVNILLFPWRWTRLLRTVIITSESGPSWSTTRAPTSKALLPLSYLWILSCGLTLVIKQTAYPTSPADSKQDFSHFKGCVLNWLLKTEIWWWYLPPMEIIAF